MIMYDKILLFASCITIAVVIGWKRLKHATKENTNLQNKPIKKELTVICPKLSNPNWVKIGHVKQMKICPIAFGTGLSDRSFQFTQDGMRTNQKEVTITDGMFRVFNDSIKKFQNHYDVKGLENISMTVLNNDLIEFKAPRMRSLRISSSDIIKSSGTYICDMWCKKRLLLCTDCGTTAAAWLNKYFNSTNLRLLICKSFKKEEMTISRKYEAHNVQTNRNFRENNSELYIGLPRYIVTTTETLHNILYDTKNYTEAISIHPNIFISTPTESRYLKQANWEWIRIGNAILRKIPVQRYSEIDQMKDNKYFNQSSSHEGVFYELYLSGDVEEGDNVYIDINTLK